MKLMKMLFAVTCLLGLIGSGFAQNADNAKAQRTFGYVDQKTGIFHPLNRSVQPDAVPAVTPTTGTFVFNVTMSVSASLPTTAVIVCIVTGGVDDLTSGAFSNAVGVTAKRTGSSATCTVNVPYSWDLANPTKDTVDMDLEVSATVGTFGSDSFYEESFTAPAITMKVPANGTTTTKTITTSI
jgi:hypothetical protein